MRKGLGVMPQAPACPNCESGTLWLTADPDTPFQSKSWVCSNAPDCGYIAEDYNGSPLASFDCPRCARPLQLIRSLKRTKWRCSGWFQEDECTAIFEDRGGVQIQLSERDLFPIRTTRLHPGAPVEVAVKGLTQPMFVIGMDARSLRWVAEQFEQLKQRGALGVVVAAEDPEAFARLRSDLLAQGVLLDLGFGDAMAESYGLSSYPALLVAP